MLAAWAESICLLSSPSRPPLHPVRDRRRLVRLQPESKLLQDLSSHRGLGAMTIICWRGVLQLSPERSTH
ncbi:hypothetical protein AGOR_G00071190 [Albula goreensis]|uniref:Uncharacterized protein n=1 Tax=Albula goreensis TaxID=1534307 RepID=A0A8T3DUF3_9TELE|nr:hypothetical protein AGOR_G00071190 [Albula goreensis]